VSPKSVAYGFRITLRGIAPPVWRQIEVPATYSLWDLHVAIQDAMGWKDCHLHAFRFDDPDGRGRVEVGIPNDDPSEGEPPVLPGWEQPIREYFESPGMVVEYEYDFGDSWEHDVLFEGVVSRVKGVKYPRCTGGARACPPEDCGGIHGYEELLSVIFDPLHPEYKSTKTWLGDNFDPEHFDPAAVTFDNPRMRWKYAFEA
jgi:hypothetical protein